MFRIKIVTHFSAAHFLANYQGKCENLHGHNWKVEVIVCGAKLNLSGLVIDFSDLKQITNKVLEELDHHNLSDLAYFAKSSASSEEIARYIFEQLKPEVGKKAGELEEVRVWETDNSCASYSDKI